MTKHNKTKRPQPRGGSVRPDPKPAPMSRHPAYTPPVGETLLAAPDQPYRIGSLYLWALKPGQKRRDRTTLS